MFPDKASTTWRRCVAIMSKDPDSIEHLRPLSGLKQDFTGLQKSWNTLGIIEQNELCKHLLADGISTPAAIFEQLCGKCEGVVNEVLSSSEAPLYDRGHALPSRSAYESDVLDSLVRRWPATNDHPPRPRRQKQRRCHAM